MGWGKVVLLFQAIVTLILGMVFFAQLLQIDQSKIEELKMEISEGNVIWKDNAPPVMVDLKQRYTVAAWVLLVVSLMEILLISRLTG